MDGMKKFLYLTGVCLLLACNNKAVNANEAGFATAKPDTIDIEQEFAKPNPAAIPTNSDQATKSANSEERDTKESEIQHFKDDEPENQHTNSRILHVNPN